MTDQATTEPTEYVRLAAGNTMSTPVASYRRGRSPNLAWKNQHVLGRWSNAVAIATMLALAGCGWSSKHPTRRVTHIKTRSTVPNTTIGSTTRTATTTTTVAPMTAVPPAFLPAPTPGPDFAPAPTPGPDFAPAPAPGPDFAPAPTYVPEPPPAPTPTAASGG